MPGGIRVAVSHHHWEDESFYLLEGEMAFLCGSKWLKAGPGMFIHGPREIAHGFKVIGNFPARMLLMCTPGGVRAIRAGAGDSENPAAGPTAHGLLRKRQQEGESMCTPTQMESWIGRYTASDPGLRRA